MSSDSSDGPGCGSIIIALILLVCSYFVGLTSFEEPHQWWHYLVALPVGVILLGLYAVADTFIGILIIWLGLPVIAGTVIYLFVSNGNFLWLLVAGILYLVIGGYCGIQANKTKESTWAINNLTSFLAGIVMLVWGGVGLL